MNEPTAGMTHPTALNALRRHRELAELGEGPGVDVLVIGGGVTGAGIALDAASRGMRTVLVERHDLAFGSSRFSSKLVHGGLRYLAEGQVAVAAESARERHLLMTWIAPHLTRPLAQVMPLHAPGHRRRAAIVGTGYVLGDLLRRAAGTSGALLPPPRLLDATAVLSRAPGTRRDGLHGGVCGWDGQLFDDARLVVGIARTAAGFGARILTRVEAVRADGDGAWLRDVVTGHTLHLRARAVLNATGVWAGTVDASVKLRPSRGTHLVVDAARLGSADVSLTIPLPGSASRFVFTVPAPHGRAYVGLTDVAADLPVPEVAEPTEDEIHTLLQIVGTALERPLERSDVQGAFAGLRPLLAASDDQAPTSDLSRRHAVITSADGVLSVVGGKLTTYRRMAEDGVDAAVRHAGLRPRRRCLTHALPLVGAWPRQAPPVAAPARLVRRYGAEAPYAARLAAGPPAACGVSAQELEWGVRVEGALSIGDLVDRRTRLGLVDADADASAEAAASAFARAGVQPLSDD